uniref:Uncharacterized protein n=1 Tax=Panagrellus redivivus TaxID=6233 RepID=A0A7E4UP35_PANRE
MTTICTGNKNNRERKKKRYVVNYNLSKARAQLIENRRIRREQKAVEAVNQKPKVKRVKPKAPTRKRATDAAAKLKAMQLTIARCKSAIERQKKKEKKLSHFKSKKNKVVSDDIGTVGDYVDTVPDETEAIHESSSVPSASSQPLGSRFPRYLKIRSNTKEAIRKRQARDRKNALLYPGMPPRSVSVLNENCDNDGSALNVSNDY